MNSIRFIVALTILLCLGTVARADDRDDVVQLTREYVNALRSLDFDRIQKCHEPLDAHKQVQMTAEIKFWLAMQKIRNLAEERFGPVPAPEDDVGENWDWGVPPIEHIDAELKADPNLVKIDGNSAHVSIFDGISFTKIEGRWLVKFEEPSLDLSLDEEAEAFVHRALKRIYDDLEAKKIDSVKGVRDRVSLIWPALNGGDPSKVPQ